MARSSKKIRWQARRSWAGSSQDRLGPGVPDRGDEIALVVAVHADNLRGREEGDSTVLARLRFVDQVVGLSRRGGDFLNARVEQGLVSRLLAVELQVVAGDFDQRLGERDRFQRTPC